MSKMSNLLLSTMLLSGGLMGDDSSGNNLRPEDIDVTPKDKPIPKGCKRYYFNENGLCNIGEHKVFFDCLKPQTAYKKYGKWKQLPITEVK